MPEPSNQFQALVQSLKQYAKQNPWNLLTVLILAEWAQLVLFGTGGNEFTDFALGTDYVSAIQSNALLFVGFLWLTHTRYAKFILAFLALVLAAVSPLCLITGGALINPQNIDTLLATDFAESWSLLSTIPLQHCIPMFILAAVVLTLLFAFVRPFSADERRTKKIWGLFVLASLPLLFLSTPIGDITLSLISGKVLQAKKSTWHVTGKLDRRSDVKNYVLVIGESLRADALQLYGNRYPTSPFLNSVPVKFVGTMVSPCFSTMCAVPLLLALTEEGNFSRAAPENNTVALAKEAGFQTYWVSAQGQIGSFEIPISRIAASADEQHFESKHDDFGLLPIVQKILKTPTQAKRLIVVHTYGSHENTCDRVKDFKKTIQTGKEPFFDCYLASAHKADTVLRQLADELNAAGEAWSMIFTADHALEFYRTEAKEELTCCRNAKHRKQYEVPFVELGFNVRRTVRTSGPKSLADFPQYFPTWIGVTTNKTPAGFNIFAPGQEKPQVILPPSKAVPWDSLEEGGSLDVLLR